MSSGERRGEVEEERREENKRRGGEEERGERRGGDQTHLAKLNASSISPALFPTEMI